MFAKSTLLIGLLVCGLGLLFVIRVRSRASRWLGLGLLGAIGLAAVWVVGLNEASLRDSDSGVAAQEKSPADPLQLLKERPLEVLSDGYVASHTCRECHPSEHASWNASYHRSMTQVATPSAVIGDFQDRHVSYGDASYFLHQRGDQFWVEMDDPDAAEGSSQRIERPIVMTTGSHHMQVYWYSSYSRVMGQLPIFYLRQEQMWVPRDAAFLRPVDDQHVSETGRWNVKCMFCHTTHPMPRFVNGATMDTRVAEFGIACEACHGPGAEHVRLRRANGGSVSDDPIVNPAQLPAGLASQVCGQCHSVNFPLDRSGLRDEMNDGPRFRPGQPLAKTRVVVKRDATGEAHLKKLFAGLPAYEDLSSHFDTQFWQDGMIRVSGREYNGLLESRCHVEGGMSCLSCHALHRPDSDTRSVNEWRDDQLKPGMRADQGCLECHERQQYAATTHTFHDLQSAGSRCNNCHMPHTTYALLKAIRSHQISSPNVSRDDGVGRPNACNLCHLDKPVSWAAGHLQRRYGQELPQLDEHQQEIAAGVDWALRGDAGQRALVAWHMGWPAAVAASGSAWLPLYLSALLEDSYNAVRLLAYRSLSRQAGFRDLPFQYIRTGEDRSGQIARQRWQQSMAKQRSGRAILIEDGGVVRESVFQELLKQRDDRPVQLAE